MPDTCQQTNSRERAEPRRATGWSNILGLWRLCRKAKCVRAHACCGDSWTCMRAHFKLLPDSVQAWFLILMQAREDGLSFEDAMASLRGTDAEEGFFEWRAAIGQPMHVEDA